MNFTSGYMRYFNSIVVQKNKKDRLGSIENLFGKKVGVVGGYSVEKLIGKHFPKIKLVQFADAKKLLNGVIAGKIDAAISNHQVVQHDISSRFITDIVSISILGNEYLPEITEAFGVQKKHPLLHSAMQKAIDSLDNEKEELQLKWFGELKPRKITFTANELTFLKNHGAIRYCIDPSWKPLEFRSKDNRHQGMSADFINLFSKNSGVTFEFVPTKTWAESLRFLEARRCDFLPLAAPNQERLKYMAFTAPYVVFPLVIATKSDVSFISDFRNVSDKTFAVVRGYVHTEIIRKNYEGVKLIEAKDVIQGLDYVRSGKVFGFIDTVATISQGIEEENIVGLKIAGKLEGEWRFSIGVRNDLPVLLSIMNKNLDYIEAGDKRQIFNRWIAVRYERGFDYQLFWRLLAAMAVVGLFLLYRYRVLSRVNTKLTYALALSSAALESTPDGVLIVDQGGKISRWNRRFVELWRVPEHLLDTKVTDPALQYVTEQMADPDAFLSKVRELYAHPGESSFDMLYLKDGRIVERYSQPLMMGGAIAGRLWSFRDLTERKHLEERLHELAFYDHLTGLANRSLLHDRLRQAMFSSGRSGHYGALLLIDLDNFKSLNDTYGHHLGDLLLKQVAQRLSTCVRSEDTVARFGGDEFVVMLTNLGNEKKDALGRVELVGGKVMAVLNEDYHLENISYSISPSIGANLFLGQQVSTDTLLKQVDLAMYKAKDAGRNTLRFFDPEMERMVMQRARMEEELRQAIENKQFVLHYQPQIAGSRISGCEVLVRWQHPERGMVSPAEFIPLAEETGLILPVGNLVLEIACAQLAIWAGRADMAHLTIAVNVSAHQFHQSDFVEQVLATLKKAGANPEKLKLELTESLLVSDVDDVIEKMYALKARGVSFSLDDFGTGYSSLMYLKRLPLDQLKIDQSFVRDVLVDPNDASIARTIIALSETLGIGVIAEGVETADQQAFLANAGCHAYQGYLFGHPLPIGDFEAFFRTNDQ